MTAGVRARRAALQPRQTASRPGDHLPHRHALSVFGSPVGGGDLVGGLVDKLAADALEHCGAFGHAEQRGDVRRRWHIGQLQHLLTERQTGGFGGGLLGGLPYSSKASLEARLAQPDQGRPGKDEYATTWLSGSPSLVLQLVDRLPDRLLGRAELLGQDALQGQFVPETKIAEQLLAGIDPAMTSTPDVFVHEVGRSGADNADVSLLLVIMEGCS